MLQIKHKYLVKAVLYFIELLTRTDRSDEAEKIVLLFEEIIREDQDQKWATSMKAKKSEDKEKEKPIHSKELFYKAALDQIRKHAYSELTLESRVQKIQFQLELVNKFENE